MAWLFRLLQMKLSLKLCHALSNYPFNLCQAHESYPKLLSSPELLQSALEHNVQVGHTDDVASPWAPVGAKNIIGRGNDV